MFRYSENLWYTWRKL